MILLVARLLFPILFESLFGDFLFSSTNIAQKILCSHPQNTNCPLKIFSSLNPRFLLSIHKFRNKFLRKIFSSVFITFQQEIHQKFNSPKNNLKKRNKTTSLTLQSHGGEPSYHRQSSIATDYKMRKEAQRSFAASGLLRVMKQKCCNSYSNNGRGEGCAQGEPRQMFSLNHNDRVNASVWFLLGF